MDRPPSAKFSEPSGSIIEPDQKTETFSVGGLYYESGTEDEGDIYRNLDGADAERFIDQFSPVREEPIDKRRENTWVDDLMSKEIKEPTGKLVTFDEQSTPSRVVREPVEQETYSRSGPLLVGITTPKGEIISQKLEEKEEMDAEKSEILIYDDDAAFFTRKLICELVRWRDVKKSSSIFLPGFLILSAACFLPILAVICYSILIFIIISITLRLYILFVNYFVDSDRSKLECYLRGGDLKLEESRANKFFKPFLNLWNLHSDRLRDILLAKNIKEALLVGFLLWLTACLTRFISFPAILLLVFTGFFTLPKFYETYKEPIDKNLVIGRQTYEEIRSATREKFKILTGSKKNESLKKE